MPGNSFGESFKITNWGESHGKAIGVMKTKIAKAAAPKTADKDKK